MQNLQESNEHFSSPCVDNSAFLEKNADILSQNIVEVPNSTEKSEKVSNSADKIEQISDFSAPSNNLSTEIKESTDIVGLKSQIERDFKDFEVIYPNISKNSLLSDDGLRIFAEGKESKPLSVVYAQYKQFIEKISEEAIKQEQTRQNNAISSVGGLSSAKSGNDGYFTREQVLKMTQDEIKRNFKRIRESQARW